MVSYSTALATKLAALAGAALILHGSAPALAFNPTLPPDNPAQWRQSDPRWGGRPLGPAGGDTVGNSGCMQFSVLFAMYKQGDKDSKTYDFTKFHQESIMDKPGSIATYNGLINSPLVIQNAYPEAKVKFLPQVSAVGDDGTWYDMNWLISNTWDQGKGAIIHVKGHWVLMDYVSEDKKTIHVVDSGFQGNTIPRQGDPKYMATNFTNGYVPVVYTEDIRNMPHMDGTEVAGKNAPVNDGGTSGFKVDTPGKFKEVRERELEGLNSITVDQISHIDPSGIHLDPVDTTSLDVGQRTNAVDLAIGIQDEKVNHWNSILNQGIMLIGIISLLYASLFFLAYCLDQVWTLNLTKVTSFGRFSTSANAPSPLGWIGAFGISLGLGVLAAFVMSGSIMKVVGDIMQGVLKLWETLF